MSTRKPKTRYDYNRLKQYCDENNIELTKNYNSKEKINRETRIEAKCLNCSGEVKKNFREFLNSGCFCETCTKQNARLKTRETQLNNGSATDYLELIKEKINIYNCTDVSIHGKPIGECLSKEIHRDVDIEFTCNCGEKQSKPVRSFLELGSSDADGGRCRICIINTQGLKIRETQINNGSATDYLELIKEKINIYNCTDVSINGKPIGECLSKEIHRQVNIEFTCNCGEKQSKPVRDFVELVSSDADGGRCRVCILKNQRLKIRETQLKTGNATDYLKLILEKIDIYNCTDVSIHGKPIGECLNNEIHRQVNIEFTCNCGEKQSKPVRDFVELVSSDADGGKCKNCIKIKARNKIETTCVEKYGTKNPMQNSEIFEKNQKARFKMKEYIFPSGRIDSVQGYEPQALDYFITNGGNEDDIITDTNEIELKCGKIFYHFKDGGHRYYPDLYQISKHKIIEVKSDYIFKKEEDKNLKKREACINAEINFEFWIMEENGNLLKII